jgi:hypothetical protein
VATISANVFLEPPEIQIPQSPFLEMEVCDERQQHMNGDKCGMNEMNACENELRMDVDECDI